MCEMPGDGTGTFTPSDDDLGLPGKGGTGPRIANCCCCCRLGGVTIISKSLSQPKDEDADEDGENLLANNISSR